MQHDLVRSGTNDRVSCRSASRLLRKESQTKTPISVFYIAGYGHSGSTLLNIVLDQHPNIMGAGELYRLVDAWQSGEFCSCGSPLRQCIVWLEIIDRWSNATEGDPIHNYGRLQKACEHWRSSGEQDRVDYAAHSHALFAAIQDVTGSSLIVDASKLPGRAAALARVPDIDLRLLHLVRDGRGVAWSLRRRLAPDLRAGLQSGKRERSVIRTGLLWMINNLAVEHVGRKLSSTNVKRLTYERIVDDPRAALREIGDFCGIDISAVADQLMAKQPLSSGHVMAGNRLRMNKAVRLRPDFEWRHKLSPAQQRLFRGLCWPVLRRYGYLGTNSL